MCPEKAFYIFATVEESMGKPPKKKSSTFPGGTGVIGYCKSCWAEIQEMRGYDLRFKRL